MLHRRPTIETFHISIEDFKDDLFNQKIIDDVQMWRQSLVTLTLSDCILEDQTQIHLGSLRKLSLLCVHGSDEAFQQLICGCPSLQELIIDGGKRLRILNVTNPTVHKLFLGVGDDSIALNSPTLKILDIAICEESSSYLLEVIYISSLQQVNVEILPWYSDQVMAFIGQFRSVEVFTLSHHAFSGLRLIKKDYPQNRWKRLVLHPHWNDERCLKIIFELVKSSVELEDLIIYNGFSSGYGEMRLLLKTVTIHCNEKCFEGQLQIVEFC